MFFTGAKIKQPRWLVNELNPLAKNQNLLVFGQQTTAKFEPCNNGNDDDDNDDSNEDDPDFMTMMMMMLMIKQGLCPEK